MGGTQAELAAHTSCACAMQPAGTLSRDLWRDYSNKKEDRAWSRPSRELSGCSGLLEPGKRAVQLRGPVSDLFLAACRWASWCGASHRRAGCGLLASAGGVVITRQKRPARACQRALVQRRAQVLGCYLSAAAVASAVAAVDLKRPGGRAAHAWAGRQRPKVTVVHPLALFERAHHTRRCRPTLGGIQLIAASACIAFQKNLLELCYGTLGAGGAGNALASDGAAAAGAAATAQPRWEHRRRLGVLLQLLQSSGRPGGLRFGVCGRLFSAACALLGVCLRHACRDHERDRFMALRREHAEARVGRLKGARVACQGFHACHKHARLVCMQLSQLLRQHARRGGRAYLLLRVKHLTAQLRSGGGERRKHRAARRGGAHAACRCGRQRGVGAFAAAHAQQQQLADARAMAAHAPLERGATLRRQRRNDAPCAAVVASVVAAAAGLASLHVRLPLCAALLRTLLLSLSHLRRVRVEARQLRRYLAPLRPLCLNQHVQLAVLRHAQQPCVHARQRVAAKRASERSGVWRPQCALPLERALRGRQKRQPRARVGRRAAPRVQQERVCAALCIRGARRQRAAAAQSLQEQRQAAAAAAGAAGLAHTAAGLGGTAARLAQTFVNVSAGSGDGSWGCRVGAVAARHGCALQ
eukprot:356995-Chlamydomonas_euryale.AAC.6